MKTKVCSKCNLNKKLEFFHYRKDSGRYRNQCKECWKYITAARRYNVSFEQAKQFYHRPSCMCCGELFVTKKNQHLHHVDHKVKGILCKFCNLALRQETNDDLYRIRCCIEFMSLSRENLFDRVNQQGSQPKETDPSTTECPTHLRQCKFCSLDLPIDNFYRQKYKSGRYGYYKACKECIKIFNKTYKYGLSFEQISILRSTTHCDCCKRLLDTPYIHHVGNKVLGVLCIDCNLLLEQESDTTLNKLKACQNWMVMIQSDLHGDMQRRAEMARPLA